MLLHPQIHKHLHKLQNFWFDIFIFLSYSLYILFAIGIIKNAPEYLDSLDYYVKIYISLFLLWRFNPFRKVTFTDLDRKIVFSAGLFLFSTTAINKILTIYLDDAKYKILENINKTTTEMFQ